jgi:hypothetical protein
VHLRESRTLCKLHLRGPKNGFLCKFLLNNKSFKRLKRVANFLLMAPFQVLIITMLEWREREHEEDDAITKNDLRTVVSLRECGRLKKFRIPGMRSQLRLLEYLVHMWYVDQQLFHVGVHTLTLDIEDIYFLTSLSRHGSHATLTGGRGGGLHMSEYLHRHCVLDAERSKGKVSIWEAQDLTIWTILFTIAFMVGIAAPHMDLQSYFQYVIECTKPHVFN